MTKARITITVDEVLLERIDQIAESQGQARSALIERLLSESVAEEEMLVNPAILQLLRTAISSPEVVSSLTSILGRSLDSTQAEVVGHKLQRMKEVAKGRKRKRK